jgi:hypothetical protein
MHIFLNIILVIIFNLSAMASIFNAHVHKSDAISIESALLEQFDAVQGPNLDNQEDLLQSLVAVNPSAPAHTHKVEPIKSIELNDSDVSARYSIRAPPARHT